MRCVRCKAVVQRATGGKVDTAIALSVTGLFLFFLSNAYPLVAMNFNGTTRAATLMDAAYGLFRQGHPTLSIIVFTTTILTPFIQIAALLYLLVPLRKGRVAPAAMYIFRFLAHIRPWTLVEVFMLGVVVALVRLAKFAQVMPGVSLWSLVLLMITLAALTNYTSPEQFWRWMERRSP
jgi:paraquat-inducible protein A